MAANGIHVYPQKEYDEDPEERVLNDRIRVRTQGVDVDAVRDKHTNTTYDRQQLVCATHKRFLLLVPIF